MISLDTIFTNIKFGIVKMIYKVKTWIGQTMSASKNKMSTFGLTDYLAKNVFYYGSIPLLTSGLFYVLFKSLFPTLALNMVIAGGLIFVISSAFAIHIKYFIQ